jgi:transposase
VISLRHEFVVFASQEGANIRELCRRYGISPKTGYKWLGRFRAEGVAGLADRSRRPHTTPARAPQNAATADMLLRDFLAWIAREPRTYAEAMDAWRSHRPRFTAWEDAIAADLIEVVHDGASSFAERRVALTARGQALLAGD